MRSTTVRLMALSGAIALAACGSSSPNGTGFQGSGGSSGAGGSNTTGAGGSNTTGTGGASTGGAPGTGGEQAAGTGGSSPDAGASGGQAGGGTGGRAGGTGGSSGVGGASGGVGGSGGAGVMMSDGCGKPAPATPAPVTANHNYARFPLTVPGQPTGMLTGSTDRLYYVRLPNNYNPAKPYRVVYLGPGCGVAQDSSPMLRKGYPLETDANTTAAASDAILVQMEPGFYNPAQYNSASCIKGAPPTTANACQYCFDDWAYRTTIPDMTPATPTMPVAIERAYFDLLHKTIESTYCVDKSRQFFAGYSSGAWMAQQLGCWFPDVLRAQANVTGGLAPPILANVNGANNYCVQKPIAAMAIHDILDQSNVYQGSVDGLKRIFAVNKCTGTFAPPPNPNTGATPANLPAGLVPYTIAGVANGNTFRCWKYSTCPAATPIVFCVSNDQMHGDQSSKAVRGFWEFFSQF